MTPLAPDDGPIYRPGDELTGAGLAAWQHVPLLAGARHFHALHHLYGVALGLLVRLSDDQKHVIVTPGVALDAYHRPLVLDNITHYVIPDGLIPGTILVLVLHGGELRYEPLDRPLPQPTTAHLEWLDSSDPLPHGGVPLATYNAPDKLNFNIRANALRAFRRPHLARGVVQRGTTALPYKVADSADPTKELAVGWRVWVDTSLAGFLPTHLPEKPHGQAPESADKPAYVESPVYIITVGRPLPDDVGLLRQPDGPSGQDMGLPCITLSEVCHHGFLLTVNYGRKVDTLTSLTATPLEIRWLGVEQRPNEDLGDQNHFDQSEVYLMTQAFEQTFPWPEFRDTDRLTASALNDVQETMRKLQWLHNRVLHDWGVGEGFAVTALPDKRGVLIQHGIAFDVKGREIIASEARQLLVPPQKIISGPKLRKTWWVCASYNTKQAPRDGDTSCRMQGVPLCYVPEAVLRWVDPDETEVTLRLQPGLDIILANVQVEYGQVVAITIEGRRTAVPSKRPYVGAGRSEYQSIPINETTQTIPIDTSSAAFVSMPQYLIQLELGELVPPTLDDLASFTTTSEPQKKLWLKSWKHLHDEMRSLGKLTACITQATERSLQVLVTKQANESQLSDQIGLLPERTKPGTSTLSDFKKWIVTRPVDAPAFRVAWIGVEV